MSARPMTRRSLLTAGAGAVAGALLRPGATLALPAATARAQVWVREIGTLPGAGATVQLGRSADLVGVEWSSPRDVAGALRFADRLRGAGPAGRCGAQK